MKHPATVWKLCEGRRFGIVGDVYRFLFSAERKDGKYDTFEAIVPPGSGPPPHIHSREQGSFFRELILIEVEGHSAEIG